MHLTLFGEVQLFLLIAVTSASFLYWINHKYKSLNRQIIRAIDIPVYLLNRQGIVVKLLNTPTEKANRLPFLNPGVLNINNLVTDADECRKYMTSLLRVLNTRTSDSLTLKIRIESGEKLYIAVRMVYLNRNYVIAFIRDITEDEVQRRENEKYRFFLESILENLPIATTVKDKNDEGRYLIWNKKAAEMMEVPAEDIVGHYEEEFKPLMQDNFIQETDKEVEESETPQSYIKHFVNPKGREYILSFHKTLVSYNKGKERWIVSSALDITELLAAKEKAEEANRLKSAFLANMSHEIRTPLNAIVGFSRIIAESTDAEERKNYYDIVEANNERLLQLINEILDLSKIEAGMVEFTIAPMRLHLLCNEIYNALKFRCPMGVELVYEASDEDIVIEGDKNRIFQVVSNLIGNAFKFTTNGSVSYGYRRKGNEIEFHVSDTGIGIEADKLSKVFERFVKVNNFAQGTGLGLSICKTIIERLGGTISVSSEMGKGTTFLFTLPLSESKKEAAAKQKGTADEQNKTSGTSLSASGNTEKSDTVSGSRKEPQELQKPQEPEASKAPTILIAEDTDSNYVLVKAILGKLYRLERAKDGMEAVTMFEELHPELILMDMKMPNLGGLDATKIIRELSPKTPIIALTAYAYEHDKQAAIDAGCNDFLTKPYTQEVLKEMIKKYLK